MGNKTEIVVLTKSAGSSNGHLMPGEASGGHPHGDHLLPSPVPSLHQHPPGPDLPLDLPAAASDNIAAAVAAATAAAAALGGAAPPEQPLGAPQLNHSRKINGWRLTVLR